jgi:hypothetical protein
MDHGAAKTTLAAALQRSLEPQHAFMDYSSTPLHAVRQGCPVFWNNVIDGLHSDGKKGLIAIAKLGATCRTLQYDLLHTWCCTRYWASAGTASSPATELFTPRFNHLNEGVHDDGRLNRRPLRS